jgi:hypothetical protein
MESTGYAKFKHSPKPGIFVLVCVKSEQVGPGIFAPVGSSFNPSESKTCRQLILADLGRRVLYRRFSYRLNDDEAYVAQSTVDDATIIGWARSAGLFDELERWRAVEKERLERQQQRDRLAAAQTSAEIGEFIAHYQARDLEGLLPEAKSRLVAAQKAEEIVAKQVELETANAKKIAADRDAARRAYEARCSMLNYRMQIVQSLGNGEYFGYATPAGLSSPTFTVVLGISAHRPQPQATGAVMLLANEGLRDLGERRVKLENGFEKSALSLQLGDGKCKELWARAFAGT